MSNYERQLAFFIDANIPEWYIDTGDGVALLAANVKNISYGELVRSSVQLTDGEPRFDDEGELLNPWTQFAGSEATAEMVVDNNYNWWDACKLHGAITGGTAISSISISNLTAVPRALGTIRLSASDIVHYNAYTVSGGNYTFQLANASFETASFTPAASYSSGDAVRLIEMPIIISAQNSATPATGYFSGLLDAANPVYETMIEGSSAISGTQLEFSVYIGGRVIFRSRCNFDCLSAISPGEGVEYLRPNVWAEADSRYLQFANLELTAAALPYGSAPTATPVVTGEVLEIQFGIPAAILEGSFLEFNSVTDNKVTFAGSNTLPVALLTAAGNTYPVERGSIAVDTVNNTVTLDVTPYLAYDNVLTFSGTWRAYFAAGAPPSYNGFAYGIDYDTAIATADSACKRVVLNVGHDESYDPLRYLTVDSFAQMPAHNFRRCVMSDLANRTVAYYLNASDSTKKEDGTAADLTGGDGDVMVEIPICYYRIDTYTDSSNHVHNVYLVSEKPFPGSAVHRFFFTSPGGATARVQYVGAFRNVLCDSAGTPKTQSDANTPASYASGDMFRSVAGHRPHGNTTRANYRTGAGVNGGTNINSLFGQYLMLMMAIDGGTLDTQTGISIGYSQLASFAYAALRKTGRTAVFGNCTGEVLADETEGGEDVDLLTMSSGSTIWSSSVTRKVVQFAYRGIEDPFGSQFCFEDGIQKYQNASDFTESGYWCTNDPAKYSLGDSNMEAGAQGSVFPAAGYTGSEMVWVSHAFPKAAGYVKEFDPLTFFALSVTGGSSSTYLCDYLYGDGNAGARGIARGGYPYNNTYDGESSLHVGFTLAHENAVVGCRIAC